MTEDVEVGFVLLIDDEREQLEKIERSVREALKGSNIGIRTWQPMAGDDAVVRFDELTASPPLLVVTDYNLTASGRTGLFGSSIVAMAKRRAIPVGDYSRDIGALTEEPDVFEFRLPRDPAMAGGAVANIASGFLNIATMLADVDRVLDDSPAALLADLLGKPEATAPFSLYNSRIAVGNPALVQMLRDDRDPSGGKRNRITAYVLGHILFNTILRFPGPIMHSMALAAYVAASPQEGQAIGDMLPAARYRGPFSDGDRYYWQDDVDIALEQLATELDVPFQSDETIDVWRRRVVERALARPVLRHACANRCNGDRGGYWCPFMQRPVCDREDCSVPSSSWIPEGANLTRVEREFFDEWAPLMGL